MFAVTLRRFVPSKPGPSDRYFPAAQLLVPTLIEPGSEETLSGRCKTALKRTMLRKSVADPVQRWVTESGCSSPLIDLLPGDSREAK
jgi:hypothetical protein